MYQVKKAVLVGRPQRVQKEMVVNLEQMKAYPGLKLVVPLKTQEQTY